MALDLIRARCPPPEGAMEEDDGEVELTLGLSVGGSSRKAPMADAAAQERAAEAKSGEAEFDFGAPVSSPTSSPLPLPPFLHVDGGGGGAAIDQARRREIHALRRREARRKRDEKKQQQHQKRGICRATSGGAPAATATGFCGVVTPPEKTCSPEDRLAMEAQENQVRAKDREARVEAMDSVPHHKLSANRSPNPNADANPDPILNPNLVPFTSQSFPVVAMPYSYPHLQYFPTTNGFGIPCMMPCWAPPMSPGAEGPRAESSVFHPVACRSFQPHPSPADEATNMMGSPVSSNAVESNAGKRAGVGAVERAPSWTASQGSSSSPASSGHHSGSPRGSRSGGGGGGSSTSDERSHTRQTPGHLHPHPQPPLLPQLAGLPQGQSDSSISSRPAEPDPPPEPRSTQTPLPNGSPSPAKPVVVTAGGDTAPPPLPRMPCVSATGDGPNGRTITGVLYRYTKAEVCIVCACHGSSFSPAEFVRHAGGTDVTHPLRQITVVSS